MRTLLYRLIGSVTSIRPEETTPVVLMFAYSFLAMTSYNIVKPLTRSEFIATLGSDNLPYVLFAAGVLIGGVMHLYTSAIRRLPPRHVIPFTQAAIIGILVLFWGLLQTGAGWVTVAFYFFGLILGILLISQFWTLANDVFDARQAKRLFGFIGGGASLGGALGAGITAVVVEEVGSEQLVLVSAVTLAGCTGIVLLLLRRHPVGEHTGFDAPDSGVGGREGLRLLAESRPLQVLALTVACAAAGAAVVDQQLNMAAEAMRGDAGGDSIAALLAEVTAYLSIGGFVVQVALISRIHRSAGIGVALLLLPFGFSASAALILFTGTLWAVAGARVLGSTLRYTLDKTTREVLFVPLPAEMRHRAKPFIDVTMDRFAKAVTAVLLLGLIQPWGLGLDWRQLSWATLAITGLWIAVAVRARREYLRSFRASIDARTITPEAVMTRAGEAATVETLVEELSNPDPAAVLYAIEMLEALDKPHLVTPLLLRHESGRVRVRALHALASGRSRVAHRWKGVVERMTRDDDVDVRAAALEALASLAHQDAATVMAGHLADPEPRVAVAAAAALARSGREPDAVLAAETFRRLIEDTRDAGAEGRREAARALARIRTDDPRFRTLLATLLHDHRVDVVLEAIRSARALGASDGLFLPGLLSRLAHRNLKHPARETLVAYGEASIPALRYALENPHEQVWVRRHVPSTLARLPHQAAMDALVGSLDTSDRFLRYKVIAAIERLRRNHPSLAVPDAVIEAFLMKESTRYCNVLSLGNNLLRHAPAPDDAQLEHARGVERRDPDRAAMLAPHDTLLERALRELMERNLDRIYRLLGILHEVGDVAAARHAIDFGDPRRRARGLEYLDNVLPGNVRKRILPLIDETPLSAKVEHANRLLGTRPRDLEDTLAQLIHDTNPVIAATAVHFAARHLPGALTDDLHWVNTHRAATDPHVGDTASWALSLETPGQASTPADVRRLPTAEIANRLSRIPIFEFVSVDELFRVIDSGQQVWYAPDQPVGTEGATEAVELLIEGSVRRSVTGGDGDTLLAPGVLGLEEALQGAPTTRPTWASQPSVCLRIRSADFVAMVSDDDLLAQGLFRLLLTPADGGRDRSPAHLPAVTLPQSALQPFDEAMLLRHHPLLGRAAATELLDLVRAARRLSLEDGEVLVLGDAPAALCLVLEGAMRLESDGAAPIVAGPGGTLFVAETLAGGPAGWRATAQGACRILRAERDDVYTVLSDRVDLLQDLFSGALAGGVSAPPEPARERRPDAPSTA